MELLLNKPILAFFGGVGFSEILVIGGVAVLLFGTNKLPELGRNLARGIREFRDGIKDAKNETTKKED